MVKVKMSLSFQISKDEYLDILFEDLELPNLEKNQINKITEWKTHRSGYQTAGYSIQHRCGSLTTTVASKKNSDDSWANAVN